MITKKDLQEAIAECEGQRNPGASTAIKLAAFYTIKDHLFQERERNVVSNAYTESGVVEEEGVISYTGRSEFASLIHGRKESDIWPVMDDLMDALTAINPRLYNSVIRKLRP